MGRSLKHCQSNSSRTMKKNDRANPTKQWLVKVLKGQTKIKLKTKLENCSPPTFSIYFGGTGENLL